MSQPTMTLKLCDKVRERLEEVSSMMGHKSPEAFASVLLLKSLNELQRDQDEWLYLRWHYEETERLWLKYPDGAPHQPRRAALEIDTKIPF